jgi:putative nucleotidyltransferase with HDIG domain
MRKKVFVKDLQKGVFVEALDRPWLGTPFLIQGFILKSDQDLQALRDCCAYVYIDTLRGADIDSAIPLPGKEQQLETEIISVLSSSPPPWHELPEQETRDKHDPVYTWIRSMRRQQPYPEHPAAPLEEELEKARETHERAEQAIDTILNDVTIGNTFKADGAKQAVKEMVESIIRNPAALLCLTQLRIKDTYTATHSIDVCVLAVSFGRFLGMPQPQLEMLGLGALLHDVGKVRIPDPILNKPGRYDQDEYAQMQAHPKLGRDILEAEHLPRAAVDIAYSHHERWNGSGYPKGIQGQQISTNAMITGIADVYSALTANRPYRHGIQPFVVLREMYTWRGKEFNPTLVEEFIRYISIYPIGSMVELSSGEVGIVVAVDARWHLKPTLALLLDRDKQPYPQRRLINLQTAVAADGEPLTIQHVVGPEDYGIDAADYLELALNYGEAPIAGNPPA